MIEKTTEKTTESTAAAKPADAGRTAPERPTKGARGKGRGKADRGPVAKATHLFGSFGVAVTLLVVLFFLTLFGTLEQQSNSLYDVQRKYFESFFLVHWIGPVPIPLPGATLVMALLSANLIVGGVIRLRRGWSTIGVLVAHVGILLLFGSGLVETLFSDKGQMTLHEGESSDQFQSYFDWEIVLTERDASGGATEYVLPHDRLDGLSPADVVRFTSDRLPFDVKVTGWTRNARPQQIAAPTGTGDVDGWILEARAPAHEAEQNVPGAYVTLLPKSSSPERRGLLWGLEDAPWVATVDGRRFELDVRTRRWQLPFRVELKRFVHKEYPGTSMPKEFSSYVTKTEGGVDVDRHITMNEPLRHEGYTFYQSGWGPQGGAPGTPLFSTFSVVRNPADRGPLVAWCVILAGLVFHFGRKLLLHIQSEARHAQAAKEAHA